MVTHGFSLGDIKQLYIDELTLYYLELIYILEESGQIKEGTYQKLSLDYKDDSVDKAFDIFLTKK